MPSEDLLTVFEVAERLRVHEYTVRRWLSEGRLRFVKVGGGTRVRASDLEAFITPGKSAAERRRPKRAGRGGSRR